MFSRQYAPLPTVADRPPQIHTPIHTPQPSLSSTRSHTPGAQGLSIHEYRRQQATPPSPPSATSSGRRLKRRRAASGLNSLRTASASSITPAQAEPVAAALRSLLPPRELVGPTSFFSHIPPPSLASTSPASPWNRPHSTTPSLFSSPADAASISRTGEKTHNFNAIKHLPHRRPSPQQQVFATISFPPSSDAHDWSTPDGRPSTSSPTVSLSRFPQPPGRPSGSGLTASTNQQRQHQHVSAVLPPIASPVDPPRSAPPTVLHYRGASFDLVNPHRSLNLSAIETPDQRNSEGADYFDPVNPAALLADMSPLSAEDIELDDRKTPSRTLYNDLTAAHEAIATRSVRSVKSLQSLRDEYRKPSISKAHVTALPQQANTPKYLKPARSPSVRDRLSRAWRRGIDSFRVMDHAVAEQGGEIPSFEEQRAMAGMPDLMFSDPGLNRGDMTPIFQPRHLKRISASMSDLNAANSLYDDESMYASSAYLRDNRDSIGYPSSIIDNRHSIPFGRITGQTDYSDSVGDIHSYAFGYGNRNSTQPPSAAHANMARLSSNKGSTIDNIIDRYHDVNQSDVSLAELVEDEGNVIRLSAMDLRQPRTEQASTTTLATRISSNQSSTAPSPKTPEAFAFPPHYVFTSSEAPPPVRPLPQMVPYLPPFAPSYLPELSGLSEMTSGDTYGDTRELLMLSQPLFGGLATNISLGTLQEPASASSEALAGVGLNNDGTSPDTASHPSPDVSKRGVSPDLVAAQANLAASYYPPNRSAISPIDDVAKQAQFELANTPPAGAGHEPETLGTPRKEGTKQDEDSSPEIETARRVSSHTSPLSQRSSGVPRMWTGSPPRMEMARDSRIASDKKHNSTGEDSFADIEDEDSLLDPDGEGNDDDWETIAGQSRQTLPQHQTLSSMAGYTDASLVASYGMLPASRFLDRQQRSSSLYSDDQVAIEVGDFAPILPLFKSSNNAGVPVSEPSARSADGKRSGGQADIEGLNAPTTLRSVSRIPLALHEQAPKANAMEAGKQRALQADQLSQPLRAEQTGDSPAVQSWTSEQYFLNTGGPHTMSQLLNSGPNDDILYDGQTESSRGLPTSPGANSSLPVTSSPIVHEDSFSKFTVLGPKGNLTGTPQGTNMREVGSSLANTSSPGDQLWSSTPLRPFTSSPPVGTPATNEPQQVINLEIETESPSMKILNRPGTPGPKSPKSPKSPKLSNVPTLPLSPITPTFEAAEPALPKIVIPKSSREQIETGNLIDLREQKRREREERELARARAKSAKRASVTGQTELREMQLVRDHQQSPTEQRATAASSPVGSHHNHVTGQRKGSVTPTTQYSNYAPQTDGNSTINAGRDSSDTGSPLFDTAGHARNAIEYLRQQADVNDQHLLNVPRAPLTQDLVARQQWISWALFGCATLLPPLLILYRWEADPVVSWLTSGRILNASSGPKRLAPWVGVSLSAMILIAAVVVVVLWQVGIIL